MIPEFEPLREDEIQVLLKSPVYVAILIAGADGKFHWAKAVLDGDQVRVWSEKVARPKYIRYAWANNPHDAIFFNLPRTSCHFYFNPDKYS